MLAAVSEATNAAGTSVQRTQLKQVQPSLWRAILWACRYDMLWRLAGTERAARESRPCVHLRQHGVLRWPHKRPPPRAPGGHRAPPVRFLGSACMPPLSLPAPCARTHTGSPWLARHMPVSPFNSTSALNSERRAGRPLRLRLARSESGAPLAPTTPSPKRGVSKAHASASSSGSGVASGSGSASKSSALRQFILDHDDRDVPEADLCLEYREMQARTRGCTPNLLPCMPPAPPRPRSAPPMPSALVQASKPGS